ncbi:putative nucleic acid-binding protein [Leucobacter komagatae]|uniref:Ribonuclease VapC n=1 Tax=Leucobacter komagatae TaxID=55969 RepID=A0A542Y825_9MICO|nr:PIN domain-containing protein [Leucobacter komagatae]TQL44167.1 putative nucleic acid-binding protein [Leucobacter komagatae]
MNVPLVSCDTSVLVAALLPAHEAHERCRAAVRRVNAVPSQVLLETYRVLTSLPGRDRVPAQQAAEALGALQWRVLQPQLEDTIVLIAKLARAGRGGGAVYDAHIAASCAANGATLVTRDRRAAPSYALFDVAYELV